MTPIGRIGRYDVLGKLATGGMAEIFLARETGPQAASRELVVKRILPHVARDPRVKEMFVQEARLCMRLRHQAICPIYEFGEHGGTFFLAMEWVHGVSLRDLIERSRSRGGLPVPVILKIFADVAGALHHAHSAHDEHGQPLGIVHRDVTPENIILGYDGGVKLLDFGIAKAATQVERTQAGVLKGKFAYISPEQYKGQDPDPRSDVFSLGACLYESLTGEALYIRDSEYETMAAILFDEKVPSIRRHRPDLAEALDMIVQRALAKEPDRRFRSADALQTALLEFQAHGRHVVRPAQVSVLLRDYFANEIARGVQLDRTPLASTDVERRPTATPTGLDAVEKLAFDADLDDVEDSLARDGRRKRLAVAIGATLVVVLVLAVSAFAIRRGPTTAQDPSGGTPSPPSDQAQTPDSPRGR